MSETLTEPTATLRRVERVALITLNRPHAMNAINADMSEAVGAAIDELAADPELRVGVLTGAGTAFCAGADLKEVAARRRIVPEHQRASGFGGFQRLGYVDKPLIAAVNGFALGGGTEIVLACDLAVISEQASLGLPEVRRGLIASGGGLLRLPRQIPLKFALEAALTGTPVDARTALAWGLVNRVVAPGLVLDTALELAGVIAANAPLAVQASKRVIHRSLTLGPLSDAAAWELSDAEARTNIRSEDAREGPRAFAEKRAPQWQGR